MNSNFLVYMGAKLILNIPLHIAENVWTAILLFGSLELNPALNADLQ